MRKILFSLMLTLFLFSCSNIDTVIDNDTLTLRDYAVMNNINIGSAINYLALTNTENEYADDYIRIAGSEFNQVTPESSMKMKSCWKSETEIDFTNIDIEADFAVEHNQKFRGHTLLWYRSVPDWLRDGYTTNKYTNNDVERFVINYFREMFNHFNTLYPGLVTSWDVVNEAIGPDQALSVNSTYGIRSIEEDFWVLTLGESYVEKAFRWAHEIDKTACLFYNDFKTEFYNPKSTAVYEFISDLIDIGTPIDGIGLQYHRSLKFSEVNYSHIDYSIDSMEEYIDKYSDLGLIIEITELDIAVNSDGSGISNKKLKVQADIYYNIVSMAIKKESVKSITVWGISDYLTFLNTEDRTEWPLLYDKKFNKKESYLEFKRALKESNI